MEQVALPIFLCPGSIPPTLVIPKGITFVDRKTLAEVASDSSFNEAKYMGTIALFVSQGKPLILSDAETFVTKKGGLSLTYHIATRANNTPCKYILVSDDVKEEDKLFKCVNEKITLEQFTNYVLPTFAPPDMSKIKVTCGFSGVAGTITGHVTKAFGITYEDSKVLEENNAPHFNKVYKSKDIKLQTNGKPGGSVISIPDLGPTAHITNNTSIRSVLSGPVLEKYNNKIMEFSLKDIDPNAKQDILIRLEEGTDLDVLITGWYCYAIESKK